MPIEVFPQNPSGARGNEDMEREGGHRGFNGSDDRLFGAGIGWDRVLWIVDVRNSPPKAQHRDHWHVNTVRGR